MIAYHDEQWGVPIHDERMLFEMINLEGAQAGLSWSTILKRRSGYQKAFDNFDAVKISTYDERKQAELMKDNGIIKNRLKIRAVIGNAKAFLNIQKEYGSFDSYLWGFIKGKKLTRANHKEAERISLEMSKSLKKNGFSFVGPTICYAFIQSTGMMNDHDPDCFRFSELG
jgi:DNA-3-methyladenine glycosylase I